jgi:hypothetical protein
MVVSWKLWDIEIVATQFNVVHEIEKSHTADLYVGLPLLSLQYFSFYGDVGLWYDVRLYVCLF